MIDNYDIILNMVLCFVLGALCQTIVRMVFDIFETRRERANQRLDNIEKALRDIQFKETLNG